MPVGVAFFDRGNAEIAHFMGIIRPAIADQSRHFDISWRIVAEKRIARKRPDIALLLAGRNLRRLGGARLRAVAVGQTLN